MKPIRAAFLSLVACAAAARRSGRLIDWSAYTILPGLIDLHTHLIGVIKEGELVHPENP
jgi:imidazolonepropionase-like amidohydrolase